MRRFPARCRGNFVQPVTPVEIDTGETAFADFMPILGMFKSLKPRRRVLASCLSTESNISMAAGS
jgi:hypothetical protein